MPQRGSLLPYRGVLSFLSKAREASGSEATRVHHAARLLGDGVAARGAGAAACAPPSLVDSLPGEKSTGAGFGGGSSAGATAHWMGRGQESQYRLSLRGWGPGSLQVLCDRLGWPISRRNS